MPGWNYTTWHWAGVQQFLRSGEHRILSDPSLSGLGDRLILYQRLFLAYILVAGGAVGYIVLFVPP
jgi:hypothetical protein